MTKDEAIDRGRKIRELAQRGIEGEQANAREMLAAFMEREGLTDADLDAARPDTLDDYLETLRKQQNEQDAFMDGMHRAAQSDPRAFNTGAPDPRPRSRYGSMYVESAMRAYSVTNRWFNRTPPPDEVRTFLADLYRIANTLFP
mgnify:CR=1 FL=1